MWFSSVFITLGAAGDKIDALLIDIKRVQFLNYKLCWMYNHNSNTLTVEISTYAS